MQVLIPVRKRTVWPLSRSLAATWKIDFSFSSYGYLDVSVPRVTFHILLYSPYCTMTLLMVGFPIRKSAGSRICAPHRSLSQLVTSFFGSQCQGIHLMPFFAWPLILFRKSLVSFLAFELSINSFLFWLSVEIVDYPLYY